jgi:predicted transcriptional regulator
MPPELLERVDETARKLSLTRAGFMKLALTRAVEAEESR